MIPWGKYMMGECVVLNVPVEVEEEEGEPYGGDALEYQLERCF